MTASEAATALAHSGISVIPVNTQTKRPPFEWLEFQSRIPSDAELVQWFATGKGIAAVCGPISGGLEVLDFDIPGKHLPEHADKPPAYGPWKGLLREHGYEDLLRRLIAVKTPSGGIHIVYRCPGAGDGNLKLAMRTKTEVLIETRGKGGYFLIPPTDGYVPLSGSFDAIPIITEAEREILHTCARMLNEHWDKQRYERNVPSAARPGDAYNLNGPSWEELLGKHGWKIHGRRGQWVNFTRPDKNEGVSAGYNEESGLFHVFSSSTAFELGKGYSKFSAYCLVPETLVLTDDLRWVQVGALTVGDGLVGVDEEISSPRARRKLSRSFVEGIERRTLHCYRVEFDDGRVIVASDDHGWLTRSPCSGNTRWVKTKNLMSGQHVCGITPGTWTDDTSYEAGWLAGFFDGEGHCGRTVLSASQVVGPIADKAMLLIEGKGFSVTQKVKKKAVERHQDITVTVMHRLPDILRFLGQIRPGRLLYKYPWVGRSAVTTDLRYGRPINGATVVSVDPIGDKEVVAMQTTSRTFIAEGLISHNCVLEHSNDFFRAAQELGRQGYGGDPERPAKPWDIYGAPKYATTEPLSADDEEELWGTLDSFDPLNIEWLWDKRIPIGALTMIQGDPGLGKSIITAAIATTASIGGVFPCGQKIDPCNVVFVSTEDDPSYILRPRFESLGADLSKISILATDRKREDGTPILGDKPVTVEMIYRRAERVGARLIVLDPLIETLAALGVDVNKSNEVRPVLAKMRDLSRQCRCATLIVHHNNKNTMAKTLYRSVGTIDIPGSMRSVFAVGVDPDDGQTNVFYHVKHNWAKKQPSYTYVVNELADNKMEFLWGAVSSVSPEDMNKPMVSSDDQKEAMSCTKWLKAYLADGAVNSRIIAKDAKDAGFGKSALETAKKRLGIVPIKKGYGSEGYWLWALDETQEEAYDPFKDV